MHVGKKSQKREKSVMSVSLYGNVVFVVIELIMAIATGSQAVLLDAVYDGVEFFMLLPSVFLIPLLYRPSNEQHPFGYMQLETLFVVIKGITMTAVTFGLIFNNIHLMLHGGHIVSFHTIAGFEMFACILSVIVTIYLRIKNKNLHSPLITMELQGWQIDSVISLGMAFAFLLPLMIPFAWFDRVTPYLDQIITILLSVIMIQTPVRTVITGIRDLMLIPPEEETIENAGGTEGASVPCSSCCASSLPPSPSPLAPQCFFRWRPLWFPATAATLRRRSLRRWASRWATTCFA